MHLLASLPNLRIYHDEERQWLYAQWEGRLTKPAVLAGCAQLVVEQEQAGTSKLLNDNSLITEPWPEGIAWGARVWVPAMAQAGLHHLAWVYSAHLLSQLVFDQAQLDVGRPLMAAFDDVAQAAEWLQNQRPGGAVAAEVG